jgi:2-hydroxychromene-2-carboxylate isomerase
MPERPVIYFDLASPYAYLAVERGESVLGHPVDLEPVLLGAMFPRRGWGSWALTNQRQAGMNEVEERARRYGLPPLAWRSDWPANSLAANRAATWAKLNGAARPFAHAVYQRHFGQAADIADVEVLAEAAEEVGLDPDQLREAVTQQQIKDALRQATDGAWQAGVRGVPSIRVADRIFYGDDKLEDAAAELARQPPCRF